MTRTRSNAGGEQGLLFPVTADRDPPAAPGSDTSAAAAKAAKRRSSKLRLAVFDFIRRRGAMGATDEEVSLALGIRLTTAGPRRYELAQKGLIVKSGQRRPTTSGSPAAVWVAVGACAPWTAPPSGGPANA